MTRRKVLQDLFYDAYGIIEDNGRDSKEGDDRIDQALADLAQIEESERLTEEEIEKIMIDFWSDKHPQPCFMDMEKITELARAITQAQAERRSR